VCAQNGLRRPLIRAALFREALKATGKPAQCWQGRQALGLIQNSIVSRLRSPLPVAEIPHPPEQAVPLLSETGWVDVPPKSPTSLIGKALACGKRWAAPLSEDGRLTSTTTPSNVIRPS
jgi:hypothetical protein